MSLNKKEPYIVKLPDTPGTNFLKKLAVYDNHYIHRLSYRCNILLAITDSQPYDETKRYTSYMALKCKIRLNNDIRKGFYNDTSRS